MFKEILKIIYFNQFKNDLSKLFVPKNEVIKHNEEIIQKLTILIIQFLFI